MTKTLLKEKESTTCVPLLGQTNGLPVPNYEFDEVLRLGIREIYRRNEPAVIHMPSRMHEGVSLEKLKELLSESTVAMFCRPKDPACTERSKITKTAFNEFFDEEKFNAPGASHGFRIVQNMRDRPEEMERLLGRDFRPIFPFQDFYNSANVWVSYMGPPGRMHFDELENFNFQMMGRKLFTCLEPNIAALYPRPFLPGFGHQSEIADIHQVDFERYPKARELFDRRREILLEPGQMIYLPLGWWHQVRSLDHLNANFNFWLKSAKIFRYPYILIDAVYKATFRRLAGFYDYQTEPLNNR